MLTNFCSLATGAGKSSILNAILDGMHIFRNCVASPHISPVQTTSCPQAECEVSVALLAINVQADTGSIACTAVVTEIAYHNKPTVDADVSFLTAAEWKEELSVLLQDLVDEDGTIKRSNDLKSDAGVAWQKVGVAYETGFRTLLTLSGGACCLSIDLSRSSGQNDAR